MIGLIRYKTARAALADARSVDEVKDIRDKAEAMRAHARMANDTQLEMDAAELRLRAERRLGIMLAEQKRTIGLNKGGATPRYRKRTAGRSTDACGRWHRQEPSPISLPPHQSPIH
jgi:hypothetical protein